MFEKDRAAVAQEHRRFKDESGQALRSIYEAGLKQLALWRPLLVPKFSVAGSEPVPQQNTPQTDAQRRLTDLARRFTQQSGGQMNKQPGRVNQKGPELAREKEWEPEP